MIIIWELRILFTRRDAVWMADKITCFLESVIEQINLFILLQIVWLIELYLLAIDKMNYL